MKLCPKTAATASGTEARETENAFPESLIGAVLSIAVWPPAALGRLSFTDLDPDERNRDWSGFSASEVLNFVFVPYGRL